MKGRTKALWQLVSHDGEVPDVKHAAVVSISCLTCQSVQLRPSFSSVVVAVVVTVAALVVPWDASRKVSNYKNPIKEPIYTYF